MLAFNTEMVDNLFRKGLNSKCSQHMSVFMKNVACGFVYLLAYPEINLLKIGNSIKVSQRAAEIERWLKKSPSIQLSKMLMLPRNEVRSVELALHRFLMRYNALLSGHDGSTEFFNMDGYRFAISLLKQYSLEFCSAELRPYHSDRLIKIKTKRKSNNELHELAMQQAEVLEGEAVATLRRFEKRLKVCENKIKTSSYRYKESLYFKFDCHDSINPEFVSKWWQIMMEKIRYQMREVNRSWWSIDCEQSAIIEKDCVLINCKMPVPVRLRSVFKTFINTSPIMKKSDVVLLEQRLKSIEFSMKF